MIVDQLQNWQKYFSNPVWKTIFDELAALNENSPEGEKKIAGDEIILKVFRYTTLESDDEQAQPETHRKYLDVHTTISGGERIEWFPSSSLTVTKPYDSIEDETVYACPGAAPACLLMLPGIFALFGPEDAHRPRLHPDGTSRPVKKAVMKISINITF